jgi:hypothetical protein
MPLPQLSVLSAAACIALIYIFRWIVDLFRPLDTWYSDVTRGKGGVITACRAKRFCASFLWENLGYVNAGPCGISPSPSVKILTFLDIRGVRHLVADYIDCEACGCTVENCDYGFESKIRHGCVCRFCVHVILCIQKPSDGPIHLRSNPRKCLQRRITSEVNSELPRYRYSA